MRNLNLDQLQTLIAIADLGTFAAAAQALHLAPPTVSLHIKELESRLSTSAGKIIMLLMHGKIRQNFFVKVCGHSFHISICFSQMPLDTASF